MDNCKYCQIPEDKQRFPCLECEECELYVHLKCLKSKKTPGNLIGDVFFQYTCAECSPTGVEIFKREKMIWLFVIGVVLNQLAKKSMGISNNGYFHWKTHLGSYIAHHWDSLFDSSFKRKRNYSGTFSGVLSHWSNVFFESGSSVLKEPGWWRIADGFSPALIKYLYEEVLIWKQKDKKNASLVASDKILEYNVFKNILSQIGFDHILKHPSRIVNQIESENQNDNDDFSVSSPKSEIHSEISPDSYRGDIMNSDAEDYFSNYLMECDDSMMMSNFDDILLDFEEAPGCSYNAIKQKETITFKSNSNFNDQIANFSESNGIKTETMSKNKSKTTENYIAPPTKSLFSESKKSDLTPWKSNDCFKSYSKLESSIISEYEEIQIFNNLNTICKKAHFINVDKNIMRMRSKFGLRRLKRNRHVPLFDLDSIVQKLAYYPTQDYTKVSSNNYRVLDQYQHTSNSTVNNLNYAIRLVSTSESSPFISPYSGKLLKPYIWHDTETSPLWLKLMDELQSKVNKDNSNWTKTTRAPLIYCYVRPHHIASINSICAQFFWPGIDLSDTLLYPEFSCVVLYKKIIVGFAFLVPNPNLNEAYISFIFTRPEWRNCGIANFMLYHLTQTCVDKDITLHVSASNPAIFLYQKFGFKVEQFLQQFYDKYFPPESKECKHALFLRLSRS